MVLSFLDLFILLTLSVYEHVGEVCQYINSEMECKIEFRETTIRQFTIPLQQNEQVRGLSACESEK